jgi:hypothetical protein
MKSLVAHDQRERQQYQNFVKTKYDGDWEVGAKEYAKSQGRSPDDIFGEASRLRHFVTMARQFTFEEFTSDDWNNFWLLAQHCDFDRSFQKWAADTIMKTVGLNDHVKYLLDRISCASSGSQKYGTQDICEKCQN